VIRRSHRRPALRGAQVAIPATPPSLRARFARLEHVTGRKVDAIQDLVITGLYLEPFVPVRLSADVSPAVRQFVEEHRKDFRGLRVRPAYLREYPYKEIGAQLFGTLSEINPDQLGGKRYRGVRQGSVVGQNGLERTYDEYLRGTDGVERIYVDAAGLPIGSRLSARGRAGYQLRTSIDLKLEKVGQAALQRAGGGKPGAFVALDPYTGEVFAMGSAPSFDPNVLARPLTEKRAAGLFGPDSGAPLTNRAVSSQYSTGSTFKPVTALAALAAGVTSPGRVINDQGTIQLFPGKVGIRTNAGSVANGPVDLRKALSVSSDIYFYLMGKEIFYSKQSRALQSWARRLGFGRLTGIDTGVEAPGVVPSRAWRDNLNKTEADCRKSTKFPSGKPKPKGAACGIADGTNRPYSAGDNVNLAIGQGDLQATPLQVALSYSAIATGGRIPTPHIGVRIEDENGKLVQKIKPKPARRVALPPVGLETIREGLRSAASDPGGTSADVFSGWDQARWPVYGKTGTAQYTGKPDQSWYAAYVPRSATNRRPLLVVAPVERGGFGAEAAAPLVRQIFSEWYLKTSGAFKAGKSASR